MKYALTTVVLFSACLTYGSDLDDLLEPCTVCHGINLQGNLPTAAPAIAGMEAWYLRSQLDSFRKGTRGVHQADFAGMEMQPQAALLDATFIDDLVEHISKLAKPEQDSMLTGNPKRGERLYQSCAACHGADGRGNAAFNAPGLAEQSDWYLQSQLNNYLNDIRNTTPSDQQMSAAAKILDDEDDVRDVVSYIFTLSATNQ